MAQPTERDLLDRLRALEDAKARICAAQAELAVRLDATVRARHQESRILAARQGRDVAGLVAYARRESPAKGSRLLGLAHALIEQPHTLSAMKAGALSEWRATLISRETACLSREDRAAVDVDLCTPDPVGGYPFDGWGDRRLVAETQKLVIAVGRPSPSVASRCARLQTPCPSCPHCCPPPKASPSGPP